MWYSDSLTYHCMMLKLGPILFYACIFWFFWQFIHTHTHCSTCLNCMIALSCFVWFNVMCGRCVGANIKNTVIWSTHLVELKWSGCLVSRKCCPSQGLSCITAIICVMFSAINSPRLQLLFLFLSCLLLVVWQHVFQYRTHFYTANIVTSFFVEFGGEKQVWEGKHLSLSDARSIVDFQDTKSSVRSLRLYSLSWDDIFDNFSYLFS